jgi:hypothetical protein
MQVTFFDDPEYFGNFSRALFTMYTLRHSENFSRILFTMYTPYAHTPS